METKGLHRTLDQLIKYGGTATKTIAFNIFFDDTGKKEVHEGIIDCGPGDPSDGGDLTACQGPFLFQ